MNSQNLQSVKTGSQYKIPFKNQSAALNDISLTENKTQVTSIYNSRLMGNSIENQGFAKVRSATTDNQRNRSAKKVYKENKEPANDFYNGIPCFESVLVNKKRQPFETSGFKNQEKLLKDVHLDLKNNSQYILGAPPQSFDMNSKNNNSILQEQTDGQKSLKHDAQEIVLPHKQGEQLNQNNLENCDQDLQAKINPQNQRFIESSLDNKLIVNLDKNNQISDSILQEKLKFNNSIQKMDVAQITEQTIKIQKKAYSGHKKHHISGSNDKNDNEKIGNDLQYLEEISNKITKKQANINCHTINLSNYNKKMNGIEAPLSPNKQLETNIQSKIQISQIPLNAISANQIIDSNIDVHMIQQNRLNDNINSKIEQKQENYIENDDQNFQSLLISENQKQFHCKNNDLTMKNQTKIIQGNKNNNLNEKSYTNSLMEGGEISKDTTLMQNDSKDQIELINHLNQQAQQNPYCVGNSQQQNKKLEINNLPQKVDLNVENVQCKRPILDGDYFLDRNSLKANRHQDLPQKVNQCMETDQGDQDAKSPKAKISYNDSKILKSEQKNSQSPYNLRSQQSPLKNQNNQQNIQINKFGEFIQSPNEDLNDEESLQQLNVQSESNQNIQKLIDEVTKREEKWTKEQDSFLVGLVARYRVENIEEVHEELNNYINSRKEQIPLEQHPIQCQLKTEVECMDRWLLLRNNTEDGTVKQIKGNWTPEEDMILKKKVAEFGLKKWKEIATFLPGRIGKQCRERWYNNVDPNLNKEKWTIAEDLQLMELHKIYGNKWVQIQKLMPGRIDNDIKNRFNASLRKYKTFEQYLEANDKKREKSKKKYYWRQHYELRNVNNSKRLPLNDQDKEFKDMAQQKIQLEVGSNLPPLKNDIILEKKKELEEYREFRKLKAKMREEKKLLKIREKLNKKKNSANQSPGKHSTNYGIDSQLSMSPYPNGLSGQKDHSMVKVNKFDSCAQINSDHQNHLDHLTKGLSQQQLDISAQMELKQENVFLNQNLTDFQDHFHQNSQQKYQETQITQEEYKEIDLSLAQRFKTHHQILTNQYEKQNLKNSKYLVHQALQSMIHRPTISLKQMRADANYKEHFKVFRVPRTSTISINVFQSFESKHFRELYMPLRNDAVVDDQQVNEYLNKPISMEQVPPIAAQKNMQFFSSQTQNEVQPTSQLLISQEIAVDQKQTPQNNAYNKIIDQQQPLSLKDSIQSQKDDQIMESEQSKKDDENNQEHQEVIQNNEATQEDKIDLKSRNNEDKQSQNQINESQDTLEIDARLPPNMKIKLLRKQLQQKIEKQLEQIRMIGKKQQEKLEQENKNSNLRKRVNQNDNKDLDHMDKRRKIQHNQPNSQANQIKDKPININNIFGKSYIKLPVVNKATSSQSDKNSPSKMVDKQLEKQQQKALYFIKKPMSNFNPQQLSSPFPNSAVSNQETNQIGPKKADLQNSQNSMLERIRAFQKTIQTNKKLGQEGKISQPKNYGIMGTNLDQKSQEKDYKLKSSSHLLHLLLCNNGSEDIKQEDGKANKIKNSKMGDVKHLFGIPVFKSASQDSTNDIQLNKKEQKIVKGKKKQ